MAMNLADKLDRKLLWCVYVDMCACLCVIKRIVQDVGTK